MPFPYALSRGRALRRDVEDCPLEIGSCAAEIALRAVAMGTKEVPAFLRPFRLQECGRDQSLGTYLQMRCRQKRDTGDTLIRI